MRRLRKCVEWFPAFVPELLLIAAFWFWSTVSDPIRAKWSCVTEGPIRGVWWTWTTPDYKVGSIYVYNRVGAEWALCYAPTGKHGTGNSPYAIAVGLDGFTIQLPGEGWSAPRLIRPFSLR